MPQVGVDGTIDAVRCQARPIEVVTIGPGVGGPEVADHVDAGRRHRGRGLQPKPVTKQAVSRNLRERVTDMRGMQTGGRDKPIRS